MAISLHCRVPVPRLPGLGVGAVDCGTVRRASRGFLRHADGGANAGPAATPQNPGRMVRCARAKATLRQEVPGQSCPVRAPKTCIALYQVITSFRD